jgi:hypothetical protein
VTGATRIERRQDSAEAIAALTIRKEVSAIPYFLPFRRP